LIRFTVAYDEVLILMKKPEFRASLHLFMKNPDSHGDRDDPAQGARRQKIWRIPLHLLAFGQPSLPAPGG